MSNDNKNNSNSNNSTSNNSKHNNYELREQSGYINNSNLKDILKRK